MKRIAISTLFVFVGLVEPILGCNMHPGMSHEEWTSAVKDERNKKTGAVVTVSDSFFATPTQPAESQPRDSRGSGRRPTDGSSRRRSE